MQVSSGLIVFLIGYLFGCIQTAYILCKKVEKIYIL